jgi:hypothetical protein
MAIIFLLSVQTSYIESLGVRSHRSQTKSASFAQEFRHCAGATKSHLWNGCSSPSTMMLSTHTAIFFQLSVQTSSIVYLGVRLCMSQTKRASFAQKSCHCVGAAKTHLWNGRSGSRPTMTLSSSTAIFFPLSVQTSSIVYLGVRSHRSQTNRASFA